MLALQLARGLGAARIVAIDVAAERLAAARALGADTIDAAGVSPGVAIEELTGGGADVVLDTAGGAPAVLAQTFDIVRPGGTVAVVGVYSDLEMTIPLADLWLRGVTLRFGGTCPVPALWHDVVALVAGGTVDPAAIVSHRLPLDEAPAGYELFASRAALKVVLEVS
ncbi:MAG: zinc-binding dehydrogenase, partial [Actinomycetota bacterium]|nr:zinc-binding dehydrogenase [Actinomycetota bacterium]